MFKIIYIILISFIFLSCSLKPVIKHHGVPFLEKKQAYLIVNKSNINDVKIILGNPSTTSKFDNDVWIFIESKKTQSKIRTFEKINLEFFNCYVSFSYFFPPGSKI